jgi:hypothetical protein
VVLAIADTMLSAWIESEPASTETGERPTPLDG